MASPETTGANMSWLLNATQPSMSQGDDLTYDIFYNMCQTALTTGVIPHAVVEKDTLAERTFLRIVFPVTCVFGIVGNVLNLLVLSRKRHRMDRMERAANVGLIALAVSDMLFCICALPRPFVEIGPKGISLFLDKFSLFYDIYSNAVVNTFILCSTWLTVTMATSRYLAICHPLRAREIIGMTFAKCSMIIVFILCVLCNVPRYFFKTFSSEPCPQGFNIYAVENSKVLGVRTKFYKGYSIGYWVISVIVPLCLLTYCNIRLILALRQSTRMRQQFRSARQPAESTSHVITLTLIGIIVMYTLLVAPNDIAVFLRDHAGPSGDYEAKVEYQHKFDLPVMIMNITQAINFAAHFVLYCIINVHFRRTIVQWFCRCRWRDEPTKDMEYSGISLLQRGLLRPLTTWHLGHRPATAAATRLA